MNYDDLQNLGYRQQPDGSWSRSARLAFRQPIRADQIVDMKEAEKLWTAYLSIGNVQAVGKMFGVCGQTVKARLNKAGYRLKCSDWTKAEMEALEGYYKNTPPELFSIQEIATRLGRSFASVALKASRLGLTKKRTDPRHPSDSHRKSMSAGMKKRAEQLGGAALARSLIVYAETHPNAFLGKRHTEGSREKMSHSQKKHIAEHGHSRGMLGKKHSEKTKQRLSEIHTGKKVSREVVLRSMKTKAANGTLFRPRHKTTWKSGWVTIGGARFFARSKWEVNYAKYLELLKRSGDVKAWEYEPETFWFETIKRGCVSYLPDFRVTYSDGRVEYHEVKGWMDARSKTKIKRMAKYYPNVVLVVVDASRYKALMKNIGGLLNQISNDP